MRTHQRVSECRLDSEGFPKGHDATGLGLGNGGWEERAKGETWVQDDPSTAQPETPKSTPELTGTCAVAPATWNEELLLSEPMAGLRGRASFPPHISQR